MPPYPRPNSAANARPPPGRPSPKTTLCPAGPPSRRKPAPGRAGINHKEYGR